MNKDVDFTKVGKLLNQLRDNTGLMQGELGKELGVTKAAISQWESGKGIKTEKLFDIASYFDISVSELISGELNAESKECYFARNYDLQSHPDFSEINRKNEPDVKKYLNRCKSVIKRFEELLDLYVNNKLNSTDISELNYLFRNYKPESKLFITEELDYECHIMELLNFIKANVNCKSLEELEYELSKYCSLDIDVDPIIAISYNEEVATLLLSLLNKRQKDRLLTLYLSRIDKDSIEDSLVIKRLLEAGAECQFRMWDIYDSLVEIDSLDGFEGVIKESEFLDKAAYLEFRFSLRSEVSYLDYPYSINKERTEDLKKIIELKDAEPLKYYEYIVERDKQKLSS